MKNSLLALTALLLLGCSQVPKGSSAQTTDVQEGHGGDVIAAMMTGIALEIVDDLRSIRREREAEMLNTLVRQVSVYSEEAPIEGLARLDVGRDGTPVIVLDRGAWAQLMTEPTQAAARRLVAAVLNLYGPFVPGLEDTNYLREFDKRSKRDVGAKVQRYGTFEEAAGAAWSYLERSGVTACIDAKRISKATAMPVLQTTAKLIDKRTGFEVDAIVLNGAVQFNATRLVAHPVDGFAWVLLATHEYLRAAEDRLTTDDRYDLSSILMRRSGWRVAPSEIDVLVGGLGSAVIRRSRCQGEAIGAALTEDPKNQ